MTTDEYLDAHSRSLTIRDAIERYGYFADRGDPATAREANDHLEAPMAGRAMAGARLLARVERLGVPATVVIAVQSERAWEP